MKGKEDEEGRITVMIIFIRMIAIMLMIAVFFIPIVNIIIIGNTVIMNIIGLVIKNIFIFVIIIITINALPILLLSKRDLHSYYGNEIQNKRKVAYQLMIFCLLRNRLKIITPCKLLSKYKAKY